MSNIFNLTFGVKHPAGNLDAHNADYADVATRSNTTSYAPNRSSRPRSRPQAFSFDPRGPEYRVSYQGSHNPS